MKTIICLLTLFLLGTTAFSQDSIRVTSKYGSSQPELQDLMDFQGLYVEQLDFSGEKLKGKAYTIGLEEYKNGKLVKTEILFDGTEVDYFKVDGDREPVKFYFEMTDGKLKTFIRGEKYGSKKSYFKLNGDPDRYALKDFFGTKKEMYIDINKKNTIFAIITPTMHKDGSGSYCEVAESAVSPEKFGEHFGIPHYFLVTITFK